MFIGPCEALEAVKMLGAGGVAERGCQVEPDWKGLVTIGAMEIAGASVTDGNYEILHGVH